jgi:prolyl-tRNA synthetase
VRWSESFIPTLRDAPADAEAISHKLLVRAGYVRQLMSGVYSLLPLGHAVARKITAIVRAEMNAIGAQEFHLPALHPAELWQRSGRWTLVGDEMFRFKDRRGADTALGMTHEEVFTTLAGELRSYRQLPQIWFQIQTKFRDEPRPKSGLLRVREFTMKDSYSFDLDAPGLDQAFQKHFHAYRRIFSRCGLETLAVEASSGAMGGSESVEFMLASDAGEDWVASCPSCGYAANVEKARSLLPAQEQAAGLAAPERFATPGVRTIEDLVGFKPSPAPATGSTARRCWCCCAATTSWSRPSCATGPTRRRRGRPRTPRSAPRWEPPRAASARWA